MSDIFTALQAESDRQKRQLMEHPIEKTQSKVKENISPSKSTRETTQKPTHSRTVSRENTRQLPTRDEIQEFSFSLRDELKVKVQAEVPHQWQSELEEISRELNVKKLELYRFIIGEFLGKIERKVT